jgi:hypothetical protein
MNRKQKAAVAIAAAVAVSGVAVGVAFAATDGIGKKQTTHYTFGVPVHRVVIDGDVGDVDVQASARSGVEVVRETGWIFSRPTQHQYVRKGVLHLDSHNRHTFLSATEYRIAVPAGVAVEVHEHAADVSIHGAPGNVSVTSDVGDVSVDLTRAPRRVDVASDVGDVDVTVPRGTYAVTTATDVGEADVHGLVRFDLARRSIHARSDVGDVSVRGR